MNLSGIDLNLLVALDALLAESNVTRAAARVGLSQPAMSNALARLRRLLDDPVLVRTAHGMVPTPRARDLADPVRSALSQINQALRPRAQFDPAASKQTFTVAATDHAELVLLPKLMQRIHEVAPGVNVEVRSLDEEVPREELEAGRIDLVIGFFPDVPPALYRQTLFSERLVCVVREGHPEIKGRMTLKQYSSLPHVLISRRGGSTGLVDEALARRGVKRRVALWIPHFLVAPLIVAETDAIATIAERAAHHCAAMVPLRIVPPPIELPEFPISQIWHERTHADAAHRWLRAELARVGAQV